MTAVGWVGVEGMPGVSALAVEQDDGWVRVETVQLKQEGGLPRANLAVPVAAIEAVLNLARLQGRPWRDVVVCLPSSPPGVLQVVLADRPTDAVGFYRRVAAAWLGCKAAGVNGTAGLIAEANGVPVSTAHRWVREARRRGLLPAARPTR